MAPPCCSCNGRNAVCGRCVCVRSGRPCVSCRPLRESRCANTLHRRQLASSDEDLPGTASRVGVTSNSTASGSPLSDSSTSGELCVAPCCSDNVVSNASIHASDGLMAKADELMVKPLCSIRMG